MSQCEFRPTNFLALRAPQARCSEKADRSSTGGRARNSSGVDREKCAGKLFEKHRSNPSSSSSLSFSPPTCGCPPPSPRSCRRGEARGNTHTGRTEIERHSGSPKRRMAHRERCLHRYYAELANIVITRRRDGEDGVLVAVRSRTLPPRHFCRKQLVREVIFQDRTHTHIYTKKYVLH